MNPIKAIKLKFEDFQINNYPLTHFSKRFEKFKGMHSGERCFILGNGPSLSPKDLNLLADRGEVTFAMNRIFKMFPKTHWRPTYYVCEDELIAKGCLKEMNAIKAKAKFIPLAIKHYHNIKIKDAVYFNLSYSGTKVASLMKSFHPISGGIPCLGTVTTTCIFLAVYMGFSEIYLLGVDHNFKITIADDGSTVTDNTVKDYFIEGYDKDIQDKVVHDLRNTTNSYKLMKKFCEDNSVSIKNATRGGKLEVFERASFDDVINQKK